jgi:hypothetical protein
MEAFGAPAFVAPATLPPGFVAVQGTHLLRMASAGYTTRPTDDPANIVFPPRLYGDVEASQSGVDAFGIGGRVALGLAEIEVWNADRALDNLITRGTSDGRRAVIRTVDVISPLRGDFGTGYGGTHVAFAGVVQRVDGIEHQRARLTITDASERLAVPLQTERYTGAGGMEGPATLADRPKPIAIGFNFNITPVPLGNIDLGDGALLTYAVNWRSVQEVSAVRVRGVEQVSVGVAPVVGEFREWPAAGVFQLGSSPDGAVTCDVYGDNVGGYVASTSGAIRRLIQSVGPRVADDALQIESFDLAETDLPGAIGFWQGAEETTAADAVDRILAGCGAILCGARDGSLRLVDPLAEGEVQWAISSGWIVDLVPVPLPAELRPHPRVVAVDYKPNGTVLTDIAGSVPDAARVSLTRPVGGPARAESAGITTRVAQQREMRLPGLYATEAAAMVRAERWRALFEAGPRMFEVTTDRYLGAIEVGDLGAIAYPAYGLDDGAGVVVLAWREALAGRRLTLTVVTAPWLAVPPLVRYGGVGLGDFVLDVDEVA